MFTTRVPVCAAIFSLCAAALVGCSRKPPAPPAFPPPVVTVAKPVTQLVQGYFEYNGHLEPIEMVEVKARVKGILSDILFTEGEEVVQGKPLYTIDPPEYVAAVARAKADLGKAEADINKWKTKINLAEVNLARISRTVKSGSGSVSTEDEAKATVEESKAELGVAEASKAAAESALKTASIQEGYTKIAAPISGRINRTMVTRGNLVGQDAPTMLTTIVSVDPMYVYFDAPERDLVEYQRALHKAGTPTGGVDEAVVEVGVATEEGFPHRGKIDFRENRVDAGTGTIRLRGRIPNPAGASGARLLYPGLYAKVRVLAGKEQPRLVIPEDAIMTGQEGRFVYVVRAENKVEKQVVKVGRQFWRAAAPDDLKPPPPWVLLNPDPKPPAPDLKGPPPPTRLPVRSLVAIEGGLKADDVVIVNGLQKARPGAPVAPDMWVLQAPADAKK